MDAEEIARWFKKYGYLDVSYECILQFVRQHLEFGTLEVERVNGEIVGVVRYNIIGDTVKVLDCVVRKDYRFKRILKLMLIHGLRKWKDIQYIEYERGLKDSKVRRFDVKLFLGLEKGALV